MDLKCKAVSAEIVKMLQERLPGVTVHEKSHLSRDLGLDSLQCMEFVASLEDAFSVVISFEDLHFVQSVEDISGYIAERFETSACSN